MFAGEKLPPHKFLLGIPTIHEAPSSYTGACRPSPGCFSSDVLKSKALPRNVRLRGHAWSYARKALMLQGACAYLLAAASHLDCLPNEILVWRGARKSGPTRYVVSRSSGWAVKPSTYLRTSFCSREMDSALVVQATRSAGRSSNLGVWQLLTFRTACVQRKTRTEYHPVIRDCCAGGNCFDVQSDMVSLLSG